MNVHGWFSRSGDVALTIDVKSAEAIFAFLRDRRQAGHITFAALLQLEEALHVALTQDRAGAKF